jgi:hypothetical protein
MGTMPGFER